MRSQITDRHLIDLACDIRPPVRDLAKELIAARKLLSDIREDAEYGAGEMDVIAAIDKLIGEA